MKATDIRIRAGRRWYEEYQYRSPIKFGGVAVDRASVLNVELTVETRSGATARGFGSMPLGNVWAFPSRTLGYEQTLAAMRALVERLSAITIGLTDYGHPLDLAHTLEPLYLQAAAELSRELDLPEPIPVLAALVCASPFDAALHDGFGKVHRVSSWKTYGPEFVSRDLGFYLAPEFAGEHLDRHLLAAPSPRLPLYHLVGALDPLTDAEVGQPVGDGLPETLGAWVYFNGLTHFKIKLNGEDLDWDVGRVLGVERVVGQAQAQRGVSAWHYSLDFNEKCGSVEYLLEFLRRLDEASAAAFGRVQYIEQPTRRDLKADRDNAMHAASAVRPVVIDESLTDLESLQLAREMGYTGAALKACKGQSQSLLMAAAARRYGMFLCVQDLTCPGASLLHSVSLAAHVPGVAAVEANARQYMPAANRDWEERFPGVFRVRDGTLDTGGLGGVGLGVVE